MASSVSFLSQPPSPRDNINRIRQQAFSNPELKRKETLELADSHATRVNQIIQDQLFSVIIAKQKASPLLCKIACLSQDQAFMRSFVCLNFFYQKIALGKIKTPNEYYQDAVCLYKTVNFLCLDDVNFYKPEFYGSTFEEWGETNFSYYRAFDMFFTSYPVELMQRKHFLKNIHALLNDNASLVIKDRYEYTNSALPPDFDFNLEEECRFTFDFKGFPKEHHDYIYSRYSEFVEAGFIISPDDIFRWNTVYIFIMKKKLQAEIFSEALSLDQWGEIVKEAIDGHCASFSLRSEHPLADLESVFSSSKTLTILNPPPALNNDFNNQNGIKVDPIFRSEYFSEKFLEEVELNYPHLKDNFDAFYIDDQDVKPAAIIKISYMIKKEGVLFFQYRMSHQKKAEIIREILSNLKRHTGNIKEIFDTFEESGIPKKDHIPVYFIIRELRDIGFEYDDLIEIDKKCVFVFKKK